MDRALDDSIAERASRSSRGTHRGNRGPSNRGNRGGYRKWNSRSEASDIDADWVHDKYEDDPHSRPPRDNYRRTRRDEDVADRGRKNQEAKIRVDNLHYELTEDDLDELFNRIAPVVSLSLRYDRAGRSTGTAYVSYSNVSSAERAIREFDGANAAGQPIRLTLLPSGPAGRNVGGGDLIAPRNPFDTATRPGRSLFERIENPDGGRRSRGARSRSRSPRRSNVAKPPPEGVDRYVPGERTYERRHRSRSRSPKRNERRSSQLRRGRASVRRDEQGHTMVGGRPRKTQDELDREMEDYFGGQRDNVGAANANGPTLSESAPVAVAPLDEDVDMIT